MRCFMKDRGIVLVFEKSVIGHIVPLEISLRKRSWESPDLLTENSYFMRQVISPPLWLSPQSGWGCMRTSDWAEGKAKSAYCCIKETRWLFIDPKVFLLVINQNFLSSWVSKKYKDAINPSPPRDTHAQLQQLCSPFYFIAFPTFPRLHWTLLPDQLPTPSEHFNLQNIVAHTEQVPQWFLGHPVWLLSLMLLTD